MVNFKYADVEKRGRKMKNVILLLIVVFLTIFLISGLSSAQQLVGPTSYSWIADSLYGEDDGQKSFDSEYSSCIALTTDANVVAISVKRIYTEWGRQFFRKTNTSYEIEAKVVNLSTGAIKTYHVEQFYLNGSSSLATNTANFNQWIYPRQGSAAQHYVDLAKQLPNCAK
jgi:hypothetical protein